MLHDWLQSGISVRVIDVRDYDYNEGGHIKGAINYQYPNFQSQLPEIVEREIGLEGGTQRVVVFHCMRSQQRGPRCAIRFKKYVVENIPNSHGVVVYVLRGGYIRWYSMYRDSQQTEK